VEGQSIERIMLACREAGIPVPELRYKQTGNGVTFTVAAADVALGKKKGSEKIMAISTEPQYFGQQYSRTTWAVLNSRGKTKCAA
jgi:hypothetical protein